MRSVILDASILAKWFFPEQGSEKALFIKDRFVENKLSIVVPVLVYYELNNILKTAVKRYRIKDEDALKVYNAFLKLNLISYTTSHLLQSTLATAIRYDISSYDASYVSLAEHLQIPFVTADKELLTKVKTTIVTDLKRFDLD